MTVGERIKLIRKEKGMTQKQVADRCGMADSAIRKYESGQVTPKQDTLQRIANALGVHLLDLIGIGEDLDKYEVLVETPSNKKHTIADARKLYDSLSKREKGTFFEIVSDDVLLTNDAYIGSRKKAPSYSDGAIKLAKDYDTLDRWGKQALRELADTEIARMEDESRFLVETTLEPEPKIIPLYLTPAAAGYASPVFGEDYEDYTLTPDNPQGADFAVRLQGDSMEPYFPDGEVVFCNRNPLADGDIGVFVVDGTAVCKQYHKEGGVVYLFSLNRKRADVDVVLLPSSGQTLVCQGRVITKRRFPLPGK